MTKQDYFQFSEMWQSVHNAMAFGKVYDQNSMKFVFELLEDYPLQAIQQAVKIYAKQNANAPQPSDIIKLLKTGYEHLSPAEAWGRFPKEPYQSEMVTVEMLKAWDVACDFYERKQFFAAEKAFIAAYTREVAESNILGNAPKWQLSKGSNLSQLKTVVENAVAKGLLSPQYANDVLKSLPKPATADGLALIGKDTQVVKDDAWKQKLAEAKKIVADSLLEDLERERQQKLAAEVARRSKEDAAMALLPPDQQIALRLANLERYGNEVLH